MLIRPLLIIAAAALTLNAAVAADTPANTKPKPTKAATTEEPNTDLSDLGPQILLRRYERPRRFEIGVDSHYYYTSNVLLADGELLTRTADSYWYESINAAYHLPPLGPLNTTIHAQYALVRYNDTSTIDFDANAAGLSLTYPIKEWFTLFGGFTAERNYFRSNENEFYKTFDTRLGLWRHQPINNNLFAYFGYQFDWRPASPSTLTRADNAAFGGINIAVFDRLTADISYRFRLQEYLQASRTDLNHNLSLSLTYSITRYISLVAFASYGDNDSNVTGRDYDVFNGGGGLALRARF